MVVYKKVVKFVPVKVKSRGPARRKSRSGRAYGKKSGKRWY